MGKINWAENELGGINTGDKRLNKRVQKVCQELYEKPMSTINQACNTWGDTKAAYRLFDNEKVDSAKILGTHREQVVKRMSEYKAVLAIQDTTYFNYDSHKNKKGLGTIGSTLHSTQGVVAHNTLLTTLDGVPLGIFDQKIYARKNKEKSPRSSSNIKDKESYRWLEPIDTLSKYKATTTQVITVMDREGDIFDLMHKCDKVGIDFVIRSTHNRVVGKKNPNRTLASSEYLFEYIAKQDVASQILLEVEDRKTKKIRTAHLEMRFCQTQLPAPWKDVYPTAVRPEVEVSIVEVKEVNVPSECEKLHWRLITSIPVSDIKKAEEIIKIYKTRWTIEIYHRVLKSGCNVENCRLETFDRIKRCITLYSIIAWRLFWMTKINKQIPDAKCTLIFSTEEWHLLYKFVNKKNQIPKEIPSVREMIRSLARLGGFLARKNDGEPGITTIWRGWQTLNNYLHLKSYG